ncbi:MAG: HAMP domain-containing protein, partial [Anaerolineae bacterium]|nr:HAMP domain-containing protein [Anaerolineae bacterium]
MTEQQYIMWHERFIPTRWKIGGKILGIVVLVVVLSVGSLTIFNYRTLSSSQKTATGDALVNYGREAVQHAADIVVGSVDALESLALSPSMIEAVTAANRVHAVRDPVELQNEIRVLDQAWQNGSASVDDLVAQIEGNQVSEHLRQFMNTFPDEIEVFVTDIEGLNIAMTGRTGDYLQADEEWWQGTYAGGQGAIFISEVAYDDSVNAWAIDIGIPIRDRAGQSVIGVLRGTVDISVVFTTLSRIKFGETGDAALLDRNGRVLYARDPELLMQQAPASVLAHLKSGKDGWYSNQADITGNPAIVAYNFLEGELADVLGWVILLDQDMTEVNADIRATLLKSLIVAGVVAGVLALIGVWAARSIASPLVSATKQARGLAVGDITETDTQMDERWVRRRDEVGELLRAFEMLRTYVREMATHARQLAGGDLTVAVQVRGEEDALGNAFDQMLAYQQAMAVAADHLAEGDLKVDVMPQSDRDRLGNAFKRMLAYQQTMAAAADSLAVGDMSVYIEPQSIQDRLGNAFVQMIAYQQKMTEVAERLAQGDLTANITPQSERDGLGNAFAQMVRRLREMVGQVQQHATQLALAT